MAQGVQVARCMSNDDSLRRLIRQMVTFPDRFFPVMAQELKLTSSTRKHHHLLSINKGSFARETTENDVVYAGIPTPQRSSHHLSKTDKDHFRVRKRRHRYFVPPIEGHRYLSYT